MPRHPFPARPKWALLMSLPVLLALGPAPVGFAAARPPASARPTATPSRSAQGRPGVPTGTLPDSVLARVGADREVTVATFQRAWAQVQDPQHPDILTPETARRFLDLMINKEALGARALAARVPWARGDSLEFLAYRDRLMMKAVLDSALDETARRRQASGAGELNRMELGVAARETAMTALDLRYDPELVARLTEAWKALPVPPSDSSMAAQLRMRSVLPAISPADTGRAVAHSHIGDYRVSELLAQWGWLDPWARPHIDAPEAIRELARNGLFERLLRRQATERRVSEHPEIAALTAKRREYTAVTAYISREVYQPIRPDSAALMSWYRTHVADYRLPDRARIARWTLPDRAGAGRLAATLRDAATADSLIERGRRSGADFRDEITAASDSVLFREAERLGEGSIVGPDSVAGAWRVVRVIALEPARTREFAEARQMVAKDLEDSLGEQGMRRLVARVRRETPVRIHPRAIELMLAAH